MRYLKSSSSEKSLRCTAHIGLCRVTNACVGACLGPGGAFTEGHTARVPSAGVNLRRGRQKCDHQTRSSPGAASAADGRGEAAISPLSQLSPAHTGSHSVIVLRPTWLPMECDGWPPSGAGYGRRCPNVHVSLVGTD
ncbi:hypothetical protein MTO96_006933 [Rhipicephalus appendiculatus]